MYIVIALLGIIQVITLKSYLLGDVYMVMLDGINQYTHFFSEFSRVLKSGKSIFWSWHQGIGSNFYEAMTYYILSPIMLILLILFPVNSVPYLFIFAFIIKQQLAAIFMYKFLQKLNFKKVTCIVIGLLWACNSYFIHYADNPMWLDAMYLLPLIFIGIENIRENNKFLIFTIAIAISAISNYYLFFSLTIFVFIYIIIMYIIRNIQFNIKDFIMYMIKITGYYLIGVMISAIVLIPAVLAIKESARTGGMMLPSILEFDFEFLKSSLKSMYFNTSNSFNVVYKSEAMLYSGSIVILLIPLLFIPKNNINIKIRLSAIFILLLEGLTIVNEFVYLGFHGFTPPICFPFRFMYGFLALNLIITAYLLDKILKGEISVKAWYVFVILIATVIILKEKAISIIGANIFILLAYYILIKIKKEKAIIILLVIELLTSTSVILKNYIPISLTEDVSTELFYNKEYQQLIEKAESGNEIERIYENYSLMNPELLRNLAFTYGYSGLNTFTSTDNKYYQEFAEVLKLKENSIGIVNLTGNLFSNEILNIKYAILNNESPVPYGYNLIERKEKYSLYENSNYLNGGYICNSNIKESTFNELSYLEKELALINNIIVPDDYNADENYVSSIGYEQIPLEIVASNITNINGNSIDTTGNDNPFIDVELSSLPYENNEIFMEFISNNKFYSIEIEDGEKKYYISSSVFTDSRRLIDLGFYNKDIKLRINLNPNTIYHMEELNIYSVNMSDYSKQLEIMKDNSFNKIEAESNKVTAEISVDKEGILMTSIPYSTYWNIYVNGEKAIYHRVNKCFMGIEVKEGINIIEMHYVSSGFNIGLIISVAGLLILLVKYIVFRRNKENYIKKC